MADPRVSWRTSSTQKPQSLQAGSAQWVVSNAGSHQNMQTTGGLVGGGDEGSSMAVSTDEPYSSSPQPESVAGTLDIGRAAVGVRSMCARGGALGTGYVSWWT